ncbi:MAG TPA: SDR family NAD(P)-dependent oxidoreductase, partial [bacterium]|nr:SDR family NAD(P)-dependent oxidoreductase [bacterium]
MRKMLIIGATSAIARETARLFAADGDALFLVARDPEKLTAVANDLKARGAGRVESF